MNLLILQNKREEFLNQKRNEEALNKLNMKNENLTVKIASFI